jgi:hypothetical protein
MRTFASVDPAIFLQLEPDAGVAPGHSDPSRFRNESPALDGRHGAVARHLKKLTASPKYLNDVELAGRGTRSRSFFGKSRFSTAENKDRESFTLTASRCQVTTVAVWQRQT